jgi:phenylacetic acid degradation operon negative regulatory protein
MPNKESLVLQDWALRYLETHPPRAKSLVMTLFGDAIRPHGGALWLGSLIRLLAPFGINDRLVRTSVFRLAEDGWLSGRREGRRSLYTLRDSAVLRFTRAYKRVYSPSYLAWSGYWTLVFTTTGTLDPQTRSELRKELSWEGFSAMSPTVFVHPNPDRETLEEILDGYGVRPHVFVSTMEQSKLIDARPLAELVSEYWPLEGISHNYQAFIEHFGALPQLIAKAGRSLTAEQAFVIRGLLVHEYRRALLHDPRLPIELLPSDWAGKTAYELCRDIYAATWRRAEDFIMEALREEDPEAAPTADFFFERFGGLARPA